MGRECTNFHQRQREVETLIQRPDIWEQYFFMLHTLDQNRIKAGFDLLVARKIRG